MARIRKLPEALGGRVETWPVQFGSEDWPGYFIRGDDCLKLLAAIQRLGDYFGEKELPWEVRHALGVLGEHQNVIWRGVIVRTP